MSEAGSPPSIPGVVLGKQIGSGGMSAVYVGTEIGGDRQVAVKVLFGKDDRQQSAIKRFLTGAKLNKSLQHPNISKIFDYGTIDNGCFSVGEYFPDGDLNQRSREGLPLQALVKVIKDMARALDYAEAVGIVHRDIKPENILFRANGDAVLIDFDIATAISGQPSKTEQGTVFGTPEYMSPEQATGQAVDGRSDLYSLGVVLYHMLTGDLPYRADTAMGTGLKQIQEPVPKLPDYLKIFQEVIDTALAKRPEKRFQSGEDLVQRLDAVRSNIAMPEATIRSEPISTQELIAVGGDLLSTTRDSARQERQSLRLKRRRRARTALSFAVLLSLVGGGGWYAYDRGWITPERILAQLGLGEDPLLAVAWSEAQSLRQDPNQGLTSIVAAYRRVLALDPGHKAARGEVRSLNSDWKDSINEAFAEGKLQSAETRLVEGKGVFPRDPEWIQLDIDLQNRLRAERIVESTQALLASNGLSDLPSATAAIQAFQEVLRLAPDHPGAQEKLQLIALHYAGLASTAVNSGEVSVAINLLERAAAADRTLTDLDDVRKLISQATTARSTIDALLQQARGYRSANQLIKPTGENAAELYHRVLATDPDNVFAAQGLDEVTAQITASAEQLLVIGDLLSVEQLVSQAAAVGMSESVVNVIRRRLDAAQKSLDTIADSIETATQLLAIGYLTAPAGNNAVASLREVQQLDPGNEQARLLLAECAQRLAGVAREAYEFGLAESAQQYLDLALTITPEVAEWVALRDSWQGSSG